MTWSNKKKKPCCFYLGASFTLPYIWFCLIGSDFLNLLEIIFVYKIYCGHKRAHTFTRSLNNTKERKKLVTAYIKIFCNKLLIVCLWEVSSVCLRSITGFILFSLVFIQPFFRLLFSPAHLQVVMLWYILCGPFAEDCSGSILHKVFTSIRWQTAFKLVYWCCDSIPLRPYI